MTTQAIATQRALYVDLDGTLLATDILWESLLVLLKTQTWMLLLVPFWLCRGKAHLKREIAQRVTLNVATLPYRPDVLRFLKEENRARREIVLATASDWTVAQSIANHLGLFTAVLASDGSVNLS